MTFAPKFFFKCFLVFLKGTKLFGQITDLKGKFVIHSQCKYEKEITINN